MSNTPQIIDLRLISFLRDNFSVISKNLEDLPNSEVIGTELIDAIGCRDNEVAGQMTEVLSIFYHCSSHIRFQDITSDDLPIVSLMWDKLFPLLRKRMSGRVGQIERKAYRSLLSMWGFFGFTSIEKTLLLLARTGVTLPLQSLSTLGIEYKRGDFHKGRTLYSELFPPVRRGKTVNLPINIAETFLYIKGDKEIPSRNIGLEEFISLYVNFLHIRRIFPKERIPSDGPSPLFSYDISEYGISLESSIKAISESVFAPSIFPIFDITDHLDETDERLFCSLVEESDYSEEDISDYFTSFSVSHREAIISAYARKLRPPGCPIIPSASSGLSRNKFTDISAGYSLHVVYPQYSPSLVETLANRHVNSIESMNRVLSINRLCPTTISSVLFSVYSRMRDRFISNALETMRTIAIAYRPCNQYPESVRKYYEAVPDIIYKLFSEVKDQELIKSTYNCMDYYHPYATSLVVNRGTHLIIEDIDTISALISAGYSEQLMIMYDVTNPFESLLRSTYLISIMRKEIPHKRYCPLFGATLTIYHLSLNVIDRFAKTDVVPKFPKRMAKELGINLNVITRFYNERKQDIPHELLEHYSY